MIAEITLGTGDPDNDVVMICDIPAEVATKADGTVDVELVVLDVLSPPAAREAWQTIQPIR